MTPSPRRHPTKAQVKQGDEPMTTVTPVPRKETTMTTVKITCDQCKQPIKPTFVRRHLTREDLAA